MIRIEDLLSEDERILQYHIEGEYVLREFIAPADISPEYIDFFGCIEDTLHRILDEGGTPEDVSRIMGAEKPSPEAFDEIIDASERGENGAVSIDLGYIIPDYIMGPVTIKEEPEETR